MSTHQNHSSSRSKSKITSSHIVNPSDVSLFLIATDDGAVRLWKDVARSHAKLVTAFQVFGDIGSNKNIIVHWEQESCQIFAAGDPRVIRVWDSRRELKVHDLNTGADCAVTSLSTDDENLVCAGCQDGSIRLFDKRLNSHDCRVATFREHTPSSIVKAHIFPDQEKHVSVISGSESGEIRFWDKRILSSVKHMVVGDKLTAMDVHSGADVFACGTTSTTPGPTQNAISIFTLDGFPGSVFNHSNDWLRNAIQPVSCLAFHPFKVNLASGSTDQNVSVFGPKLL
jgi:regulator-associated protein of mTOR